MKLATVALVVVFCGYHLAGLFSEFVGAYWPQAIERRTVGD